MAIFMVYSDDKTYLSFDIHFLICYTAGHILKLSSWVFFVVCFVFETRSFSVDRADLGLSEICLLLSPQCWDEGLIPPCSEGTLVLTVANKPFSPD